jgi:hypothetical protein
MKPLAALAISATLLFAQNERAPAFVTAIRNWSLAISPASPSKSPVISPSPDRLHNPDRIY